VKNEKVLVVGGAGYIGGYLTDLFAFEGYDVAVYDNLTYETRYLKRVNFVYGDIRDTGKLARLLPGYGTVIWLAAMVGDGACQVDPELTNDLNFESVRWLVDNYQGRILFPSTCHDIETRLLTKRGVVYYNEIKVDDEVLTVNIGTNELEWRVLTE